MRVFVTVGMGPWPLDRLLSALTPVCAEHEVFAQTGTSSVVPPCPHQDFLGFHETQRRIAAADVVVTHGGNTVRLVQRAGKVPIAIAREAARGEMRNDHQVTYLHREAAQGRAVVLDGDLHDLPAAIARHPQVERRMLGTAAPLDVLDRGQLVDLLEHSLSGPRDQPDPFHRDPTARYSWAFSQLRHRTGRHLDLGIGDAAFLHALHCATPLRVVGADPHASYVAEARRRVPGVPVVEVKDGLPFSTGAFDSVSLLDVLEHTADERATLAEVHRVLRPGGLLVVTVPARHAFSFLDPDNVKFRLPRLHRAVYSARFGADVYQQRFVDASDGLRGDMAWSRTEHTNYRPAALLALLEASGFRPQKRDGANLFWRFFQVPALLAPSTVRPLFDLPLRADGRTFTRANLFVTAVRR